MFSAAGSIRDGCERLAHSPEVHSRTADLSIMAKIVGLPGIATISVTARLADGVKAQRADESLDLAEMSDMHRPLRRSWFQDLGSTLVIPVTSITRSEGSHGAYFR
ncbi:hypothetical protein [Nitrobacter sp. JJSN]|uniref:hypothetical protein n=1 Tax=Nitrobacter sp. JJSN TaxID=3453033 RepID=UPI003F75C90D